MFRASLAFISFGNLIKESNLQKPFSALGRTFRNERKVFFTKASSRISFSPFSTQRERQVTNFAHFKPLANWTNKEVQQWFKSSKYSNYANSGKTSISILLGHYYTTSKKILLCILHWVA